MVDMAVGTRDGIKVVGQGGELNRPVQAPRFVRVEEEADTVGV
jgi:hypothetical protein